MLGGVGGPSPRDLARFEEVAKGFETSVFSTLLKQMRDALQPDTLFPGDSADVLGGMFDMFLGQHLAQAGSLGIADAIKKQLLQRYEASTPPVGDPRRSGLSGQAVPPTPGAGTGGA
ncbi:MAG: rod-binding protein [Gemmataceae bacterium]|nr:rod-binding protein [Gemmataceae bacterium]